MRNVSSYLVICTVFLTAFCSQALADRFNLRLCLPGTNIAYQGNSCDGYRKLSERLIATNGKGIASRSIEDVCKAEREALARVATQIASGAPDQPFPTCLDRDELEQLIAPVVLREDTLYDLSGRILNFSMGPRAGDRRDPANHDSALVEFYQHDGSKVSNKPITVSGRYIASIVHDIDTVADLSHLFSNRHELAGVQFGSDQHRDLIYGLFDPDGDLNFHKGSKFNSPKIIEGSITRDILAGKENRAMFVLMDHLIRQSRQADKIFDFEGSNIPGVARFFEGFGGKRTIYRRIVRKGLPFIGKIR